MSKSNSDELRTEIAIKLGYDSQEQHSSEKIRWYDLDEYGNPTEVTKRLDNVMELIQSEISKREQLLLDELEELDEKESEFMGDSGLYLWSSHIADFINAKRGKHGRGLPS